MYGRSVMTRFWIVGSSNRACVVVSTGFAEVVNIPNVGRVTGIGPERSTATVENGSVVNP